MSEPSEATGTKCTVTPDDIDLMCKAFLTQRNHYRNNERLNMMGKLVTASREAEQRILLALSH